MAWQTGFNIKEFADFWRISPVWYCDEIGALELLKKPLDDGNPRTLPGWIDYSKKAIAADGFYVGSSVLHHSLADALKQNRKHPVYKTRIKEVQAFLEDQVNQNIWTLTRVIYESYISPHPDRVIHSPSLPDSYQAHEHMFGIGGALHTLWDADRVCDTLLGTDDVDQVIEIYKWLLGKNTFLERNLRKRLRKEERGVSLGASQNAFSIAANAGTYNSLPALGMRLHRKRKKA